MLVVTLVVTLATTAFAFAQDEALVYAPPGDESENYQNKIVLNKLDDPAGLVVREGPVGIGPHELFISESAAGRVFRVSTAQPKKTTDAITGLPVGPLGLTLLTRTKLAVCRGGQRADKNVVSVYALPIGGSTVSADQADHTVGPLAAKTLAKIGKNRFLGLAKTDDSLFIVAGDGEQAGWILKASIEANRLAFLQPFIQTQKNTQAGAPTCITTTPKDRPSFLVVGQMGSKKITNDSSITFFVPSTGTLALSLGTGLHDISGLAYSPAGNLYALDISSHDEQAGGVYRLDDARIEGKQACRATRIASVVRPTALAFTPDGTLYVTALGPEKNKKQGVLVKITGKF